MQKGMGDYRVCAMCGTACWDGVKRHSGDAEWAALCMDCAKVIAGAFEYPTRPPSPFWDQVPGDDSESYTTTV